MAEEQDSYIKDGALIKKDDEFGKEILFQADFKNEIVITNCADFYYNYSIPFDDFIKFADYIKKVRKIMNKSGEEEGWQDGTKEIS